MESKANERVSVIIPTRNRPRFLEECIRSVLAQSVPVYETIIVNDASDEQHQAELERISTFDQRLHLYNLSTNHGRSYSRNFGLNQAKGDYILFLDDDDLLDREMISTSLPHFRDSKIDVVTSLCKVLYSHDSEAHRVTYLLDCRNKEPNLFQMNYLQSSPFSCIWRWCPPIHASLIRRNALDEIKFPEDLTVGEDWFVWLSLAFAGRRFDCNRHAYAYVRRHDSNTIPTPSWLSGERMQFLQKMVSSGMIRSRTDLTILNLRLLLSHMGTNSSGIFNDLLDLLKSPFALIGFASDHMTNKLKSHSQLSKLQRVLRLF